MQKKALSICLAVLAIFVSLQIFSLVLWQLSGEEQTIEITLNLFLGALAILLAIGLIIGTVWLRFQAAPADNEVKLIGGGVIGLTFFSALCTGGMCIPAAAIGSVFSIICIVPVLLGMKLASFTSMVKRMSTIDSPARPGSNCDRHE